MEEFNPQKERAKIYDMLTSTRKPEYKPTKELIMKKAIDISMDELQELNQAFDKFLEEVSHLSIYQYLYKDVINPYWAKLDTDAQHLIKKNYTAEELEMMTREAYNTILKQQKIRLDLLKGIIKKYNLGK